MSVGTYNHGMDVRSGTETLREADMMTSRRYKCVTVALITALAGLGVAMTGVSSGRKPDVGRLASIIASSDYVVVGTVVNRRLVTRRLKPSPAAQGKGPRRSIDAKDAVGGATYELQVRQVLCSRTDFQPGIPRPQFSRLVVYQPTERPGPHDAEWMRGAAYVAFVAAAKDQARLQQDNLLDPATTYFESVGGQDGVFYTALPYAREIEVQISALCTALEPPLAAEKLRRLQELGSNHPDLAESVAEAAELVRRNMRSPNGPRR